MKRSGANLGNIRTPVKRQIPNVSVNAYRLSPQQAPDPSDEILPANEIYTTIIVKGVPVSSLG